MSSRHRTVVRVVCIGALLAVAGVVAINQFIIRRSRDRIFAETNSIAANDVALVLGTSPTLGGGRWTNPFFKNRMDAAVALYRSGKVRHLLLSGDNSRRQYDEPTAMREALIARGVPESAMTLDYAGFRTLDSVVRSRAVFGQSRITIVSDDFHLPRALFLAQAHGIEAVGFASQHVPDEWSRKTHVREIAARCAAWLDVVVLRTGPKFYGPPVPIRIAQLNPASSPP